ncbi:hypothetical protein DFJ63DRAFT_248423 [Scheffersomyces coipomensis]|uniref:uncharacterized protein n=1 Tax=Scheffersomyces coipomensis TaxID=1788519 RepID=UPI00315DE2CA
MSHMSRLQEILNYPPSTAEIPTDNEDYYDDDDEDDADDSDYSSSEEDEYQLSAQEHWEESINQVKLLVNQIMFPVIGKILGRRFSHLIWRRIANWWFI